MKSNDAINEEDFLFNTMLGLISKKCYTKSEIEKKLKAKTSDTNKINAIIAKLEEYKYVDDEAYAKRFLEIKIKEKSLREIEYKLIQKGIKKELVYKIIGECEPSDEACRVTAEKYMRNKPLSLERVQKLYAYLFGKGFESSEIANVVNVYKRKIKEEEIYD